MTACTHKSSFLKGLLPALAALLFGFSLAPSPAGATNDPNGTYSGTSLSGNNTYAQIVTTSRSGSFEYSNGTLTLTGNNGALISSTGRTPRFSLSSDSGNATLVLQKGTFSGTLSLGGTGQSTVIVGTGATSNRPTVTIDGNIGSISGSASRVVTNGANLVVNGTVGSGNAPFNEMYAQNGNIRLMGGNQHMVTTVRVVSGMEVFSQARLTIRDLDIQNGGKVTSNLDVHINGVLGSTANRMQAGSLLESRGNIYFLDPHQLGDGGIQNASGTIRAGGDIGTYSSAYRAYNVQQGSGHLTIEAGGSIGVRNLTADSITAGGTIVAGVDRTSGQISVSGPFAITPAKTLTGTNVKASLIAAGEVTDFAGVSTPSRFEAGRLMAVRTDIDGGSTGNFTLHNGSFSITGTGAVGNAEYAADGSLVAHSEAAWVGGRMDVNNNGASRFTTMGVAGAARIGGGSLSGDTLSAASLTLHNGINASINTVSVGQGAMQIGAAADSAAATDVRIGTLRQNGQGLLVGAGAGQAWGAVGSLVPAGGAGSPTDGDITVGHNGRLAVGTRETAGLKAIAARAGINDSTAVLGVFSPLVLGANLAVDHETSVPGASRSAARLAAVSGRAATGPVSFSSNSLLVIDGAKTGVNYANPAVPTRELPASVPGAISTAAPAATTVPGGAKIYIDHVTPGHTYVALGRNITTSYADDTAWNGANLLSSNPLLGLTRLGDGMEGQFSVTEKAPHTKSVGVASGVPRLSRAASESMESAIYSRIKLGEEDLYRRSFALWALPLYESIDHFGLDGGNESYGFRGGVGGLAIGGDYTWNNTLRAGISLNMGAGYVKSTGEVSSTRNSATFWGVGAYGVWKPGAFSLDAEVDLTSVYNKVTQDLPSGLDASEMKADIQALSLGMSLRAEYEIDTKYVDLRPHFGVRYLHMVSEPFDATLNGEEVLHGNRTHQNIWTLPFGIVFTKDFKLENGFEITPLLNLKAIPALGDTYARTSVRYAGAHSDQEFDSQVMDDITWGGRAGVELRTGNFTAGLNYVAQFGEHTANQGLFGVLRYEF